MKTLWLNQLSSKNIIRMVIDYPVGYWAGTRIRSTTFTELVHWLGLSHLLDWYTGWVYHIYWTGTLVGSITFTELVHWLGLSHLLNWYTGWVYHVYSGWEYHTDCFLDLSCLQEWHSS